MNPRPGIEVIICTYNGAPRLPALFAALSAQSLDAARWSVLLIDNASTDSTAGDARRLWPRPDVELRVINEPTPGQMAARERGRAETRRAFVCFCDDDNLLAPDYLETALAIIENQPALGVLGGCGDAISDDIAPMVSHEPAEWRHDVAAALESLPAHYRRIILLRDLEGLTIAEIGEQLGLTREAVKSRLHRARLLAREYLAC